MFAVPGWSVDSSALKTQSAPIAQQQTKSTLGRDNAGGGGEDKLLSSGEAKKRKRTPGEKDVNKDNLAALWDQVVEGKPKKKKRKKEKGAGIEVTEDVGGESKVGGSEDVQVENARTKKERKEKKNDIVAEDGTATRPGEVEAAPSISSSKKDKKRKNKQAQSDATAQPIKDTSTNLLTPRPAAPTPKLTPLQASMRQKLISARFRHLNQTLYTTPSASSLSLFSSSPEMFDEYHEGFRRQVEVWPENPVDGYISTLLTRGKIRPSSTAKKSDQAVVNGGKEQQEETALPRTSGKCTIADLGCGDAGIATALQPRLSSLNLKIHSFDLHSPSPLVTKADIANLPLQDNSVDVAIFCLALMGTNWVDFIEEAYRILRWKGELWIAEIKSRFGRVSNHNAASGGSSSRVVEHSVGNRRKNQHGSESKESKKALSRKEQEANDAIAAIEVDGQAPPSNAETDVSAFVEVLRKRGFVLRGDGQPGRQNEGVDKRNRMFVKMWFVKASTPVKGKGVPVPKGMKEVTGQGTWKAKEKKVGGFSEEEGVGGGSEAAVLKPCVYKLR